MYNVLLVYPEPKYKKNPRFGFSVQLLQLATILKKNNLCVYYLDYSYMDFNRSLLKFYLIHNKIDIVVVEIDSFALKRSENLQNGLDILNIAKQNNILTIAFGYGCILHSKDVLNADHLVGKNSLVEIPKIICKKPIIPDVNDYDTIPFPDRDLLLTNEYFAKNNYSTLIKTAEGCLNTCSFCQRRGWQNCYKKHTIDYVLKEFEYIKNKKYKNIWIVDENFTFDINRSKVLLKHLIGKNLTDGMKIAISSWANIDFEFLLLAKKAKVSIISMGIESANQEILDFYDKNIDLKKTKELIEYADSIGLYMVGNFIIGAPMETRKSIENTFAYILDSKLDQVNIKILDYMIGSKIYEKLPVKDEHHYFGCKENGLCNFTLKELTDMKEGFLSLFYSKKQDSLKLKIIECGDPYYPVVSR